MVVGGGLKKKGSVSLSESFYFVCGQSSLFLKKDLGSKVHGCRCGKAGGVRL